MPNSYSPNYNASILNRANSAQRAASILNARTADELQERLNDEPDAETVAVLNAFCYKPVQKPILQPVYGKCPYCSYTTFIELPPESTTNFTCPRCDMKFQLKGTWKPKAVMYLEITDKNVVPYLSKPRPVLNSPQHFAIWNFIGSVWPEVRNYVEYGYFKYYATSPFSIIVTNDPEITSFDSDVVKATNALVSKFRTFDNLDEVISKQPDDIDNFVDIFEIEIGESAISKERRIEKVPTQRSAIDDLDPSENEL